MAADPECSFFKENSGAIFAVFDDQRLWAHIEHLARGARQAIVASKHLGLAIIDEQYIDQLQGLDEFVVCSLDPVVHGIATG